MHFTGVILREGSENLLVPMRYHCRPAGKLASIDRQFPGLYNARRDNIDKFWRQQFGDTHAVMVVESFFENVDRDGKNVVLHFKPRPAKNMFIACLYSEWEDPKTGEQLLSFAAVTDEPPAEVAAAGHDRMIVNLKRENVDAWLTPAGRSDADLRAILSDREAPYYEHEVEAA
jgi:putative SOS response-associated peptidase YedK